MKMKEGFNKLRGGYYTPKIITDFICNWAINNKTESVLEPSCGDGAFISSAVERLDSVKEIKDQIHIVTGIELCKEEADKASLYDADIICSDFFEYYRDFIDGKKRFDVIIGNPPFIRYQNFNPCSREIAFTYMRDAGLHPTKLTNIWLPFLILSSMALNESGRIGMVIPAELFQVNYAGEAREFLAEYFERITLITFQHLVFDEIQQEVVLFLGEKKSSIKGMQVIELKDLEDLKNLDLKEFYDMEVKELRHNDEKWVEYFLNCEEIELLRKLRENPEITATTDLFEINVGLVSGENNFFLLNQNMVNEYQLADATKMVIGKTELLKGVILSENDFENLIKEGKKVYMFMPPNLPFSELSKEEQDYIEYGESMGYHQGYKCRIRKNWYCVPKSWEPEAFILRQVNRYPRIILNHVNAVSTDTIHKVRFFEGVNSEYVAAAFLNSFTLALSEITGRSYGGGVLTFEPGEIRKLKIPMKNAQMLDVEKIDRLVRDNRIEEVLSYTDRILLKDGIGLSDCQIQMLRGIWIKLSNRRLGRKGRVA